MSINLEHIKRAYFIGIKGVGMTALAQILKARGIAVSGSDTKETFFTDDVLRKLRVPVFEKFTAKHIPQDTDIVISSAAYYQKQNRETLHRTPVNVEIREAKKRKLPILTYPEVLGLLSRKYFVIAVAGTHGKSTTTAMLGIILEKAGLDPTVIVGTRVNQWGSNARASRLRSTSYQLYSKQILVVEADEYREAFLNYRPYGLIITSIEYDHPDYFKTFTAYKNAFRKLAKKVPKEGFIVANWDDKNVWDVIRNAKCKISRYGKKSTARITLKIPGQFNKLNAAAAAETAKKLGVPHTIIRKTLLDFRGTARRFEIVSSPKNPKSNSRAPIIVDDYAHHPTEIQVTLRAAREKWPRKEIWVVFQPHTYSRTAALLYDFAKSFRDADRVFILETYGSARERKGKVGAKELANEISKYHKNVRYLGSIPSAVQTLRKEMQYTRPVLITMGAGDVWRIGEKLKKDGLK